MPQLASRQRGMIHAISWRLFALALRGLPQRRAHTCPRRSVQLGNARCTGTCCARQGKTGSFSGSSRRARSMHLSPRATPVAAADCYSDPMSRGLAGANLVAAVRRTLGVAPNQKVLLDTLRTWSGDPQRRPRDTRDPGPPMPELEGHQVLGPQAEPSGGGGIAPALAEELSLVTRENFAAYGLTTSWCSNEPRLIADRSFRDPARRHQSNECSSCSHCPSRAVRCRMPRRSSHAWTRQLRSGL
jgi:hypothetical protein